MRKLHRVKGRVIPMMQADIDTDQIIPARHLKRLDRRGLGAHAFEAWRKDPEFVLNDPELDDAPILLAGSNFGCGSSREHAPWALEDRGIRVILAPSFADIFRNNCAKVGLLALEIDEEVLRIWAAAAAEPDGLYLEVDLRAQFIDDGEDRGWSFEVDPFVKRCLLEGLDPIGLALERRPLIENYEQARKSFMPTTRSR